MFTQPLMYKEIAKHKLPRAHLHRSADCRRHGDRRRSGRAIRRIPRVLEQDSRPSRSSPTRPTGSRATGPGLSRPGGTSGQRDRRRYRGPKEIGMAPGTPPENFALNPKILRQLEAKRKMMETGDGLDWAMGEALAYGSLLKEGYPVRLSGQDSARGTFSHRHSVLIDQDDESRYTPLNNIGAKPRSRSSTRCFGICDLRFRVRLFDCPADGTHALGSAVRRLRQRRAGHHRSVRLVRRGQVAADVGTHMLLPHGYEGMGPEHSSARLERFLQLCAEDNMQVVNCTTPAIFFHVLRRQLLRIPQAAHRHDAQIAAAPQAFVSRLEAFADFTAGTHFARVIPDADLERRQENQARDPDFRQGLL